MTIWAIADLHLSFGVPHKKMDIFGEVWENHAEKIKIFWEKEVKDEDLILIAGDISWALKLEQAKIDLDWIGALPGTKVMIRGNHDYWWDSPSKIKEILPPSCHIVQNDVFNWNGISIGGTRLWDSDEYNFDGYINYRGEKKVNKKIEFENAKIFARELHRLELSLKELDQKAPYRIVMTHYPPIGPTLAPSKGSQLFDQYNVDFVIFGHLHNVKKELPLFGEKGKTKYLLTSCDYLDFKPIKIISD